MTRNHGAIREKGRSKRKLEAVVMMRDRDEC